MSSIFKRPFDLLLVVCFISFLLIAITIDYTQSVYGSVLAMEDLDFGIWPPESLLRLYAWWCEEVDQLLAHNPMWYETLAWFSPFVYAPFYCFAIYAFISEKDWIRVPALMWGWGLLMVMVVVVREQLVGKYPTKNVPLFFAAYGAYALVPLLVMLRVAATPVFGKKTKVE